VTVDPFTFEVVRHRLWSINVEGALALQRVSGSPLATEAFDMNTSIMSAAGEVAFVGPYLLTGPTSQGMIVRSILATTADPLEPGDVLLCNDPYTGAAHQNCVTLVAPLHAAGHLIAWAGATLHVVDVGGPVAGQVGIGASSILDEAPPIPPLRIVQRGRLVPEAESVYLDRSRTPELNALDLRAKIAAINAIARGVDEVVRRHGVEGFLAVVDEAIDRTARHVRRRLGELPDGRAHQVAYVHRGAEHGPMVPHAIDLVLEKRGDRLVLDFGGSSPQAPAVINCTRSGLMSGVLVGLLATLVWDAPWCPAAIERTVEVRTTPGTIVDAVWPAGCSMATMAAGFAATTATALAVGDLLARDRRFADRAMAAWAGAVGSVDVFGSDARGQRFGTVLLDTMASGTGATAAADGIDTGGFLRSMACVIANVEHIESLFPLLYLYRRQEPDTGGPGRRRGGVGASYAVMPQGVARIETVSPHFSGGIEPESAGLAGGFPGATNTARLALASGVRARFAVGRSVGGPDELPTRGAILPEVARVTLASDDVFEVVTTGGGGFGDPIERDPRLVAGDVRAGSVSIAEAGRIYGVVLGGDGEVDDHATAPRRAAIRSDRLRLLGLPVAEAPGECGRCGEGVDRPLDEHDVSSDQTAAILPLAAAGPNVGGAADGVFALRQRLCPMCGRSLQVERILIGAE
jgi:N-methylhydantoinase B